MFTLRLVSTGFRWVQTGLRREGTWVFQRVAADINQGRLARSVTSQLLTISSNIMHSFPFSPPQFELFLVLKSYFSKAHLRTNIRRNELVMKSIIRPCLPIKELCEKKMDFVRGLEEKRNAWLKSHLSSFACGHLCFVLREICVPCNDSAADLGPRAVFSL